MDTQFGFIYLLQTTSLTVKSILVTVLCVLAWIKLRARPKKRHNLPPGPLALPLIGTLLAHSTWPRSFTALRERYGDVVTVQLGPKRIIMVMSYDAIKEATITKAGLFSDRGFDKSFMFHSVNPNRRGIIECEYTPELIRNRANFTNIFRELGVGRTVMQDKIVENAGDLVNSFLDFKGKPFFPKEHIQCSVVNVILHIALNKKFTRSDPKLQNAIRDTDKYLKAGTDIFIIDQFPFLRLFPPFKQSYGSFVEGNSGMFDFMLRNIKDQVDNFSPNNRNDFVSCLLGTYYDNNSQTLNIDKEELKYLLRDLLLAGLETTATTLQWIIIKLANHQEHQIAIQNQIDYVLGRRDVKISDKLPLLEAFVLETIRYHTIAPITPRHTFRDATLCGYDIPADTTLLLSLNDVHKDKTTWGDPYVFRPDRFLDSEGNYTRHPHVIPFSMGKRVCLGELLARQELFIFTATLLQKLSIRPPEGVDKVSEAEVLGGTVWPKYFEIVAEARW